MEKRFLSLLLVVAFMMAMGGTAAFAHHPAADSVPTETYEMITDNISQQHLDMDFDDMDGMIPTDNSANATETSTFAGESMPAGMGEVDPADVGAAAVSFDVDGSAQAEISGDEAGEVGEARNARD